MNMARLADAVRRASGDGVRWQLIITGNQDGERGLTYMLTRACRGQQLRMYGDDFGDIGANSRVVKYGSMEDARKDLHKDMILRRGPTNTRASGDLHREQILDSIAFLTKELGRAPSLREIGADVDLSMETVRHHIAVLREEGRVDYIPGKWYGIIPKEEEK